MDSFDDNDISTDEDRDEVIMLTFACGHSLHLSHQVCYKIMTFQQYA